MTDTLGSTLANRMVQIRHLLPVNLYLENPYAASTLTTMVIKVVPVDRITVLTK